MCVVSSDHTQLPNIVARISSSKRKFNLSRSQFRPAFRQVMCFIDTSIDSHSMHCSVLVESVSNIAIICNRKQAFDQSGNFQPVMGKCLVLTCATSCSMSDTQDDVALLQLQPLQEITLCMMDKLVQKLDIYVSWNRKITISYRV